MMNILCCQDFLTISQLHNYLYRNAAWRYVHALDKISL
jgi:hypothetical protein